ncbi:RdRp [hymenopteran chu-related virus 126]|uniref:RNA-directed RNA polymerase n=1 Tax=hymenopteran chu-related virus 126 TaxID=2847798 RepID=A0A7U3S1S5_9VIRU|nr:RdRp [hymenopteran chu-related virus 126]QPB73970.1 RdRp [hymenopteran chu-related virus 126]
MPLSTHGTSNRPSVRSTIDSHAFLQEEKFDTWLDLQPLCLLKQHTAIATTWTREIFKPLNSSFSADTFAMLTEMGVSPKTISNAVITPCLPAMFLKHILQNEITECHMKPHVFTQLYKTSQDSALKNIEVQLSHLLHNSGPDCSNYLCKGLDVWEEKLKKTPVEVIRAAYVVEDMARILQVYKCISEYRGERSSRQRAKMRLRILEKRLGVKDSHFFLPSLQADIYVSLDLIVLTWMGDTYILTHNYLLEIVNKLTELYCCLLYSHMLNGTILPQNHYLGVTHFLNHLSQSVAKFCQHSLGIPDMSAENRGFTYLKIIEGLGVAYIIKKEDAQKGWINDKLASGLWKSVVDEKLQANTDFSNSTLYKIFDQMSVASIAEVLGLVKLCGHPSVEIDKGLTKLQERTQADIKVKADSVRRSIGVLKRELILNFRRARGKYPNIQVDSKPEHANVRHMLHRNVPPDSPVGQRLLSGITIEMWSQVILGKNEEFDPIDNQLTLLKDKALGLTREKVLKYVLTDHTTSFSAGLGAIEERRALLAFLLRDNFTKSFKTYMEQYENDEPWCNSVLNYLVIKLTAKELEEKPEGRMFGASPGEERNRRIVQESNAMRILSEYIRDELMTPDELQMLRKLFSFRHFNKMYPHHVLLQVSFDFSKWNNSMRRASIDIPAKETLDRWFGTEIFQKTMLAYEKSLFYYKDMFRMKSWMGQLGGIEGLNQATWSFVFIGGIKQALEGLGLIYQLTVKGDDVRAALVIPRRQLENDGEEKIRDSILNQLSQLCQDMGWQLNPHECFVSLSLIATSKQYQVNDTFLPASTKKLIKAESLSNLVFPTLEDLVASIFSTAHSACSQSTAILPIYVTAAFIACRLIMREMWPIKRLSVEQVSILSLWPQCLGGPGSLPLQTFIVRGENDMLSVSVSLFNHIIRTNLNGLKALGEKILGQSMARQDDMTLLLADPYSIPIASPERPSAVLKRLLGRHMKYWVRNKELRNLLSTHTEDKRKIFVQHLTSMRPYLSRVATVLYETSPFYIKEEVLSKFMESSTIFAFFTRGKTGTVSTAQAHRTLSQVLKAASKRKNYWITTIMRASNSFGNYLGVDSNLFYDVKTCITQIVHKIREAAWGVRMEGLTYPSLVDQNGFFTLKDMKQIFPQWEIGLVTTPVFISTARAIAQTTDKSLHYSAVPGLAPWLGAQTASKLDLPKVNTKISSPTLSKVMRLINLSVNAHILGPAFEKTVHSLLEGLTSLNIDMLNTLVPEAGGGHISHRVAMNSYSLNTMPNSRPNLSQLVKMPSDSGGPLRGDSTNRTVNFAARHFFANAMVLWPLQSSMVMPEEYPDIIYLMFHHDMTDLQQFSVCPWCCRDVDDVEVSFSGVGMPDLYEYQTLSLVGCSEYEEKILRLNTSEALMGKVRREAQYEFMDPTNHVMVDIAAHVIINKLNKRQIQIFQAAQGSSFIRTPRNEMLDIMSVTMGIKSVKGISKNILRAIPANNLYRSTLNEVLSFSLDWLAVDVCPENLFDIERLMDHLNPLGGFFTELLESGLLEKLQVGCLAEELVPDFKWTAASTISGTAAMRTFMNYHREIIMGWVYGNISIKRTHLFCNMEDGELITDALVRDHVKLVSAVINQNNTSIRGKRVSSWWVVILQHIRDPTFKDIHSTICSLTNDVTWPYAFKQSAANLLYDTYLTTIMETLGLSDDMFISQFWAQTMTMFVVEKWLIKGTWYDNFEDALDSAFTVRLVEYLELEDTTLTHYEYEQVSESILFEVMSGMLSVHDCQYIIYWCMRCLENNISGSFDIIEANYHRIRAWVELTNDRRIGVLTKDDAERLISNFGGVPQLTLEDLVITYKEDEHKMSDRIRDTTVTMCSLSSNTYHDELLTITKPLLQSGNRVSQFDIPRGYYGLGYLDSPPTDQYWIDETEILRCSGIHNTSVTKYIDIIHDSHMHDLIEELQDQSCVVCLADGLGGLTARLLSIYPRLQVVYNSMYYSMLTGKRASDAHPNTPPIEVLSLPPELNARRRVIWEGLYPGDLTSHDVQHLIMDKIRKFSSPPTLITLDADIPWDSALVVAKRIWFAALNIMGQTCASYTLNVLKCQALHHPAVYDLIHTIYALFSHVHIHRAKHSRQGATECFLVFKEPRNIGTIKKELQLVSTGQAHFTMSMTINNIITRELDGIGRQYMEFKLSGVTPMVSLLPIIKMYVKESAYPLDFNVIMHLWGLDDFRGVQCLCSLPHTILTSTVRRIIALKQELKSMRMRMKRQGGPKAPSQYTHGKMIGVGWRFLQQNLRSLFRMYVIQRFFNIVKLKPDDMSKLYDTLSMDDFLPDIEDICQLWSRYVAAVRVHGIILVGCHGYNDNWTRLTYSTIRKCYHLLGAIYLALAYIKLGKVDQQKLLSYLHHNMPILNCCKHRATDLFDNSQSWTVRYNARSLVSSDESEIMDVDAIPDENGWREIIRDSAVERRYIHVVPYQPDPNLQDVFDGSDDEQGREMQEILDEFKD